MSNEWIKWEGGECPVDDGLVVTVELRSKNERTGTANTFHWDRIMGDKLKSDIVSFRI